MNGTEPHAEVVTPGNGQRENATSTVDLDRILRVRSELVDAARSLRPFLARNADEAERLGALPDETLRALVGSGALRIFVPRRFGGYEAGHRTYLEVVRELGRSGCGSSAWYGFILNMDDWLTAVLHEDARQAVWKDGPDAIVCCPLTPSPGFEIVKEKGGRRISGKWAYTSGCKHSDWALIGYPVIEGGAVVDMEVALLPRRDYSIEDTWNVIAMAGTGSHTIVFDRAFVREEFTLRMSGPMQYQFPNVPEDGHMYRADPSALFWSVVLAPVVGLAQAALDLTIERMTRNPKPISYTFYLDATKSPSVQANVAEAAGMIDSALLLGRAIADEIDELAWQGRHFATRADRHRNYMRAANAVRMCQRAVDKLLDVQGAGSFALGNPLQRIWRDLNAAARHGFNSVGMKTEIYGRTLLGADEQQMTMVL